MLVKTDEGANSVYRNMTTFLVEKKQGFGEVEPGLTVPGKIEKMGYKGVDTTELIFSGCRTSPDQILGGTPRRGFYQMMDGVEVGRVNVAARGFGVALRAFELAIGYAQQRENFGKPIADHQAVQFRLADMATKVEAAHQMMVMAARKKDRGERNDLEAGTAATASRRNTRSNASTGKPPSPKDAWRRSAPIRRSRPRNGRTPEPSGPTAISSSLPRSARPWTRTTYDAHFGRS
ncbi:hypothetical protein Misp02_34880 [Microtetraspora sp. NBRC 16547]|nr:hypothetical protein Misp02_34880 [Microtetraspora sp. NBRC 16547]